jgi:Xaa-Pro aminopeptidase
MTAADASIASGHDHAARRRAVLNRLGDGILVVPAAPVLYASRDTEHPYVADRELLWLTGLAEPGSVAVLVGGSEPRLVVFARERDDEAELWAGPRLGVEGAAAASGADEAFARSELAERLPGILSTADRIHFRLGGGDEAVQRGVLAALARGRARGARTGTGPRGVVDPGEILDDLRLVKDATELDAIRRACEATMAGHLAGAAALEPGVGEWQVEAAVEAAFRAAGATRPGFETIAGGGTNACVLHYVANADRVPPDALLLLDAGAEVDFYHGDVTRTLPASGRFAERQRAVYQVVHAALVAATGTVRPGATIGDVHDAATRTLVTGLVDLGVLDGDVDGLIEQGAHKPFFPHQTSHWLGLDVHDPGDYRRDGVSRTLERGMVFTIEPGLYFRPGIETAAVGGFEGIGVRIEDDVAVTADGCDVLTAALPSAVDDVEALAGGTG